MLRTVAQCKAAVADCEQRLGALKLSLASVHAGPDSPKRDQLLEIAKNTVRVLERELESLRRDLSAAQERERR